MADDSNSMFRQSTFSLSPELLSDWLIVLDEENNVTMDAAKPNQGFFKNGTFAQFVFQISEKFAQPAEVRYLATEILDRFMCQHLQELFEHVQKSNSTEKAKQWRSIVQRVKGQLPLRVVTACQLASKLSSNYSILTPQQAWSVLKELGQHYQFKSVLDSEVRILQTLRFRIMIASPFVYVETLLVILGYNNRRINAMDFHTTCLQLLDLVYMRRAPVYKQYLAVMRGKRTPPTSDQLDLETARVKSNYMLQASAIITASIYLVSQTATNSVVRSLHAMTRISHDEILDLAAVIIRLIICSPSRRQAPAVQK